MANVKISELPLGTPNNNSIFPFVDAGTTYQGAISAITSSGGGVVETTYSELQDMANGGGLTVGTFYLITDFKTCYDQPDFNTYGNAILTGNYKECSVDPILVFAIEPNSISTTAYQPGYPDDSIQYDLYYSQTEVTGGVAYGRISERIDEFGNRTDYDHRNIQFKRYKYIEINLDSPQLGTCNIVSTSETEMTVTGTGTLFTELSVGNYVGFSNNGFFPYEITSISDDRNMTISGLTIINTNGQTMYLASARDYDSFKQNNISTTDFVEYFTFDTDNGNHTMVNNYIGNLASTYQFAETTFMLSNNVFKNNNSYGNNIGNYSYNNTFGNGPQDNSVGNFFYNNIIDDSFYDNFIGNEFSYNRMTCNFHNNRIGNGFSDNYIVQYSFYRNNIMNGFYSNTICGGDFQNNEIRSGFNYNRIRNQFYKNDIGNGYNSNITNRQFYGNLIGNAFNDNSIYCEFYDNQIGEYFENNDICSLSDDNNFEFYGNVIGVYFNNNTIRQNFYYNQFGQDCYSNTINGDFYRNTIGIRFHDNPNIGYRFSDNKIGNYFNNNHVIGDYFQYNQIGYSFNNNSISFNFRDNSINNQFENNTLGNTQYFNWDDTTIENLTGRSYSSFYDSLDGEIGNVILGKELIIHDTVNDEYHKVKFTQWTQGGNGGGFSYERTKVYPSVESTVYFTKRNYVADIDVIVEGSLEIARGNNGGIYNPATEGSWNGSGPDGTEWNSIYTQNDNGNDFRDNTIGNQFKGNYILNDFQSNNVEEYVGNNQFTGNTYTNNIGSYTFGNDFLGYTYNNVWRDGFFENTIGDEFVSNTFGQYVSSNNIGDGFQFNQIGNVFNNNTIGDNFGYGFSDPQGNKIGNNFYGNNVGEYFYNNTIPDNFVYNTIGNYFQWNIINTNIDNVNFALNYGNITGFSYSYLGSTVVDGTYNGLTGTTNGGGQYATFDIVVSGNIVTDVTLILPGMFYLCGNTITILGTELGGVTGVIDTFTSDAIGISGAEGVYNSVSATGGTGVGATFHVTVGIDNLVTEISVAGDGSGYSNGDQLTILGSLFGGVDGTNITITITSIYSDDVTISVDGVTQSSLFYENYTKQIFSRKGSDKRVSFYDENDILTIDSIYTSSGYIPIYSQSLSFPISYASFHYWCDGGYVATGGYTNQTVDSVDELVSLFNGNFSNLGKFFNNNDGTLGMYVYPSTKQTYCPSGVFTINVFAD